MNRFVLPLLTLGLSLAPVLCWAGEPPSKEIDHDAAQLKAAQNERIKVLTQLVEVLTEQYRVGTADFPQLFSAENELCNAQLDSTDEPAKRVALLTKQLDKANDFVKIRKPGRKRDSDIGRPSGQVAISRCQNQVVARA